MSEQKLMTVYVPVEVQDRLPKDSEWYYGITNQREVMNIFLDPTLQWLTTEGDLRGGEIATHWLEKKQGYFFTPEELLERDMRVAGEAFQAGHEYTYEDEYGIVPNRFPNKEQYINQLK